MLGHLTKSSPNLRQPRTSAWPANHPRQQIGKEAFDVDQRFFPRGGNDTHSLDIMPVSGEWVQIVAYKGGADWDNGDNRRKVVSAFADKIDLKKVAAQE